MQQPNSLSPGMLSRIRLLALEQVALKDELVSALEADDIPRVVEIARRICGIEREIEQ